MAAKLLRQRIPVRQSSSSARDGRSLPASDTPARRRLPDIKRHIGGGLHKRPRRTTARATLTRPRPIAAASLRRRPPLGEEWRHACASSAGCHWPSSARWQQTLGCCNSNLQSGGSLAVVCPAVRYFDAVGAQGRADHTNLLVAAAPLR